MQLWRASNGQLAIWGRAAPERAWYPGLVGNDWSIKGVGDFDADGASDILWRNTNGQVAIWGRAAANRAWYPGGPVGAEWTIQGADSPIVGYSVVATATGRETKTCASSGETTCTLHGLASGAAYDVLVTATTKNGTSGLSNAVTATPN